MIALCYMKFLKFCEDNQCIISKNKYTMSSLNVCLKDDSEKFVPFPLHGFPLTEYEVVYFIKAFEKYKLFDVGSFMQECRRIPTEICPITQYSDKFRHTQGLKDHCFEQTKNKYKYQNSKYKHYNRNRHF